MSDLSKTITIPDTITIYNKYTPAMQIIEQAEADKYFAACVEHNLRLCAHTGISRTRAEAEASERSNLGYFSGYYGVDVQERVERLFSCVHPVFGSVAESKAMTAQDAFEAGKRMAEEAATGGIVAELRAEAETFRRIGRLNMDESKEMQAAAIIYCAKIAHRHETRWQEQRAALRALVAQLRREYTYDTTADAIEEILGSGGGGTTEGE